MILDSINHIQRYASINPNFVKAINFVRDNADTIAVGKYVLDGEDLFVMIVETDLKDAKDAKMEAHLKYIDIQIVLEGTESYAWRSIDECVTPLSPFDTEHDIIFYSDQPTATVTANKGQFVIFFPEDGHAPLIGSGRIRKAIVKVRNLM